MFDKLVARLPALMLLGIFRIGIIVRLVIESRELPLLERVAIIRCHVVAPLMNAG